MDASWFEILVCLKRRGLQNMLQNGHFPSSSWLLLSFHMMATSRPASAHGRPEWKHRVSHLEPRAGTWKRTAHLSWKKTFKLPHPPILSSLGSCMLSGGYISIFMFFNKNNKRRGESLSLIGVISCVLKVEQPNQKSVASCWGPGWAAMSNYKNCTCSL